MSSKSFYKFPAPFILLLLLPPSLPQDISFPISSQDGQSSQKMLNYASSGVPEDEIAEGVTDLGLDLLRTIRVQQGEKNWWVYSPTSIAAALYLVLLGANGRTYNELRQILHIKSPASYMAPHQDFSTKLRELEVTGSDKSIVQIANGVFVQNSYPVRQEYSDVLNNFYQASLFSVDFIHHGPYVQELINNWVNEKTAGKITEAVSLTPPPDTKLILVNTLYFKGEWAKPFPSELTSIKSFYPNGRSQPTKVKVPMMATMASYRYYFDSILNCEVVGIPYKGEQVFFYLILPKDSNKEKLKILEGRLNSSEIDRLVANTEMTDHMILTMPKMKITSEYLLNNPLKKLGLRSLFDPKEADLSLFSSSGNIKDSTVYTKEDDKFVFTRMKKDERKKRQTPGPQQDNFLNSTNFRKKLPNPGLYVSQIIHKVVMDINEIGTEAAAVTAIKMERTMSKTIKADVPFLFIIRHEPTKMALFLSAVNSPPSA